MFAVIFKFFIAVFLTIIGVTFVAIAISWLLILSALIFRLIGFTTIAVWIKTRQELYVEHLKSSVRFLFKY